MDAQNASIIWAEMWVLDVVYYLWWPLWSSWISHTRGVPVPRTRIEDFIHRLSIDRSTGLQLDSSVPRHAPRTHFPGVCLQDDTTHALMPALALHSKLIQHKRSAHWLTLHSGMLLWDRTASSSQQALFSFWQKFRTPVTEETSVGLVRESLDTSFSKNRLRQDSRASRHWPA